MKETRRQIIENTRREVARQYKEKIEELEARNKRTAQLYADEAKLRRQYQSKVEGLEEKAAQYEDWIRRLQEFMDMEPDAREKAINAYKTTEELNRKMKGFVDIYSRFASMLFNF